MWPWKEQTEAENFKLLIKLDKIKVDGAQCKHIYRRKFGLFFLEEYLFGVH
jgi:hypothetical protein